MTPPYTFVLMVLASLVISLPSSTAMGMSNRKLSSEVNNNLVVIAGELHGRNHENNHVHHDHDHHRRDTGSMACPVCGQPVTEESPYVSVKKGQQKLYTCTLDHATTLAGNPASYCDMTLPTTSDSNITYVEPSRQCMYCSMSGIEQHALQCNGNQALYACSMGEHYTRLYSEADLTSTFSGLVAGIENPSNGSTNGTDEQSTETNDTTSAAVYSDKFCYGTGTVMLNGFSLNMDNCITFLFDGWVLDSPFKFAGASVLVFLTGIGVQLLNKFRTIVEKGQAIRQVKENRHAALSELALNSSLLLISVTFGYWIMLVTMTFSTYLFVAVVLGLVVGHFLANVLYVHTPSYVLKRRAQRHRRGEPPHNSIGYMEENSSKVGQTEQSSDMCATIENNPNNPCTENFRENTDYDDVTNVKGSKVLHKRNPDTPCCPF
eukprot:CFRG4621T1